ncbi:TetR/AcrR family transcriptional regulator [Microtetraspora sp. AC03309]|uniref:TetR/AcrR family transcriptional regulator n=1 Tax=Microtetraspora sp. AC03309 TaxID=2779376 RepID=UPI001E550651|nr:TetR/AcrR family transcriptional regulator [Microtetraspora sp. AC03309]MCC5581152.1 TetR/AcrR family transcriptional regulator [Microtetraspora sp. AC03309]
MARNSSGFRREILEVASRLFAATGFKGTSLQDIAGEVGCSKAALLYHFDGKDAILTELLTPAAEALAELDVRLAGLDGDAAVVPAVEGFVDLVLRFRHEAKILYDNIPEMLRHPALADVLDISERLVDALAGRSTDPEAHVAALMVLGAVPIVGTSPVRLSDDELRAVLIRRALRTLDHDPNHP